MSKRDTDIALIEKYLAGRLDARAMHLLERRAQADPFLMDALEGYQAAAGQQLNIRELKGRLQNQASGKVKRLAGWHFISAAASIVLVMCIGVWLYLRRPAQVPKTASLENMQLKPVPHYPLKIQVPKDTVNMLTNSAPPAVKNLPHSPGKAGAAGTTLLKPAAANEKVMAAPAPLASEKADTTPLNEMVVMGMQARKRQDTLLNAKAMQQAVARKVNNAAATQMLQSRVPGVTIDNANAVNAAPGYSLNNLVQGRIISKDDGQPMPGVSVRIKGSSVATQTDAKGGFKLQADKDKTIVLGYIGYQTAEVPASAIDSAKTFAMVPSSNALSEVVVTGATSSLDETQPAPNESAHPAAGWGSYKKYLTENAVSPDGKTGTVKLSFTVYPNGTITGITVTATLSAIADQKAIRLITNGPAWAGNSSGQPETVIVKVRFK